MVEESSPHNVRVSAAAAHDRTDRRRLQILLGVVVRISGGVRWKRAEPIEQCPRTLRIVRVDPELGGTSYVVVSAETPGTKEILNVLSTYEIVNPFPFQ